MSAVKRIVLLVIVGLCLQLGGYSPAQAAPVKAKEFNFVFLHGAGGNACSMQLLADCITEQIPAYIGRYELADPAVRVQANLMLRCYPNDVDIETWAENIADSVDKHLPDKQNLILIGHSMGGKAALYAVAHDVGGLADKTAMVVTINSPVRSMLQYYFTGGASVSDYSRAVGLLADSGVINSILYYDSAEDGRWVAAAKHWLAFISAETAPLSDQFNVSGFDAMPRNMDDNIIPISAQYTDRADVVYYGEHSHNDFGEQDEVAGFLAEQILRYVFGGEIECSILMRGGNLAHAAGWLPGTDYWEDMVGEVPVSSGSLQYTNDAFFQWQEWEEVVGESPLGITRSSYQVSMDNNFPFLNRLDEARWLVPEDTSDGHLYLKTRVAPRSSVQVDWSTYQCGLLPEEGERDHYEVEIATGTPLTTVRYVSWLSDNPRDLRLAIGSEAESPFRWFKAEWRVYAKESRYRQVIDEMTEQALSATALPERAGVITIQGGGD
jgi:pimeloyl-ACP methyl ester carboxylesterase